MAESLSIRFAKTVENCRKDLVNIAHNNNIAISDTVSLPEVVQTLQGIKPEDTAQPQPENTHIVRWIGPDGLYRVDYVKHGEAASFGGVPDFDSDVLEFVDWVTTSDINNVTKDINCGALYQVKPDAEGKRWTHIYCDISDVSGNVFTVKCSSTPTILVDWGDGTPVESHKSTTITHTYAASGSYVIKFWSDTEYYFGTSSGSASITVGYQGITRFYFGENLHKRRTGSSLFNMPSLKHLVLPLDPASWEGPMPYDFYTAVSLVALIVPRGYNYAVYSTGDYWYSSFIRGYYIYPQATVNTQNNMDFKDFIISDTTTKVSLIDYFGVCHVPAGLTSLSITSAHGLHGLEFEDTSTLTTLGLYYAHCVEELDLSRCVNSVAISLTQLRRLKRLILPYNVTSFITSQLYDLEEIVLPQNYNLALRLVAPKLTKQTLINIARALKDNVGDAAKTITLYKNTAETILLTTYMNTLGDEVANADENAMTLLQYIQNKNWTVSLSTSLD